MNPAGFARRYAAWSLDAAAIAALATVVAWPLLEPAVAAFPAAAASLVTITADALFGGMMAGHPLPAVAAELSRDPRLLASAGALRAALLDMAWPFVAAYAVLSLAWHAASVASRWQASPGKRAFGLMVVGPDASRPTGARAIGRHLAAALSWLTLNIGHLMALGPAHAALHDRVAGTRVCTREETPPRAGAVAAWIALQGVLAFALAGWLLRAVGGLAAGQP
ncbi:MAG TPA: RDD family protein [Xanthomonadaceae bacterium]|nr:RDD family protein [Xanthomonadaceae bacterium]